MFFLLFLLIWKDKVFCLRTQKWDQNHVVHLENYLVS